MKKAAMKGVVTLGVVLVVALLVWQVRPVQAEDNKGPMILAMALVDKLLGKEEQKPVTAPSKPGASKPPAVPAQPGTSPSPSASAGASQAKPSVPGAAAPPTGGTPPSPPAGKPAPPAPASPPAGKPAPEPVPAVVPGVAPKPAAPPPPVTTPAAKPPEGGAVPPLPLAAPETAADGYFYDPKGRREPFQSMVQLIKKMKEGSELPPLQRVEISDMKLLGIIWGGYGYFGLIQTPDGKGYTVKEGTLLGTNGGVIKAITDKQLIVAEPTIDIAGKKTTREIEILLRAKEGIK